MVLAVAIAGLTLTGCRRNNTGPDFSNETESTDNSTGSETTSEAFSVSDVAISTSTTSKNDATDFAGTPWNGCVTRDFNTTLAVSDVPTAFQSFFTAGTAVKRAVLTFGAGCTGGVQRTGNIVVYWQGSWYDWANRKVLIWSGDNASPVYSAYTVRGNKHYIRTLLQGNTFNFCSPASGTNPAVKVSAYDSIRFGNTDGVFGVYRANHVRTWLRGWQNVQVLCNPATASTLVPASFAMSITDDANPIAGGPGGSTPGSSGYRSNRLRSWTANITQPHIWLNKCPFMYSGQTSVTVGTGRTARVITWGDVPAPSPLPTDPPCNLKITITIDGQSFDYNP